MKEYKTGSLTHIMGSFDFIFSELGDPITTILHEVRECTLGNY